MRGRGKPITVRSSSDPTIGELDFNKRPPKRPYLMTTEESVTRKKTSRKPLGWLR